MAGSRAHFFLSASCPRDVQQHRIQLFRFEAVDSLLAAPDHNSRPDHAEEPNSEAPFERENGRVVHGFSFEVVVIAHDAMHLVNGADSAEYVKDLMGMKKYVEFAGKESLGKSKSVKDGACETRHKLHLVSVDMLRRDVVQFCISEENSKDDGRGTPHCRDDEAQKPKPLAIRTEFYESRFAGEHRHQTRIVKGDGDVKVFQRSSIKFRREAVGVLSDAGRESVQ